MAALSASRNTPEWNGAPRFHYGLIPVEASTSLYVGGMVAVNANGRAVPAQALGVSPLNRLWIIGVCESVYAGGLLPPGIDALNQTGNGGLYPGATATLGTPGAISVMVANSIFGMDFDGTITAAAPAIGSIAFATDDHTVTLADGSGGTTVANTTSISIPAAAPLIVQLKPYITPGTFNAYSASGAAGTHYVENADFAVNYQSGLFIALTGGAITASGTVFVTYKYGLPSKAAAGQIVAVDGGQCYVNFQQQALRAVTAVPLAGN
jgi:hypothetical protein